MSICHIYFGDKIFGKFKYVGLNENFKQLENELKTGLAFNYVNVDAEKIGVDDLYLNWHYVLFRTGFKLWYTGYKGLSFVYDSTCDNGFNIITCCWNSIGVVTNDQKNFLMSTDDLQPVLLEVNEKIVNIQCTDNQYFIYGKNHKLIYIDNLKNILNQKCIDIDFEIVQITCGKEHSLFLSKAGSIYSMGTGSRGQLGHGDSNSVSKPSLIEALDGIPIKLIASGGWHSAAVSAYDDLYMWGWNESGQLGFPCSRRTDGTPLKEIEVVCCLPKLVDLSLDVAIKNIGCGSRHTAVLSVQGHLWMWGSNSYGQLALENCEFVDIPTLVDLPPSFKPQKLKCSNWSSLITGVCSNETGETTDLKSNV